MTDTAIELAGYTLHRLDRSRDSGKSTGGRLCRYVNNSWCTNTKAIERHCSLDLEFVTVKCRPFDLPKEFIVIMLTGIYVIMGYIPPDANAKTFVQHY